MRLPLIALAFLAPIAAWLVQPAWGEQAALSPPASHVELRTYGIGFLPFDGKFTRFHGWMRYEPSNPVACQVILEIEAGSLAMNDGAIGEQITGPDYMDTVQFPALSFQGGCAGKTVAGSLTMHGQTHPFILDLERSVDRIVATGRLRRAEWGITSHPLIGGSTIRIRVEMPNPIPGPRT